jgi:hypothetical protein
MDDYKTVCNKCGRKTWYEDEQQCHCFYPASRTCETCGHTEQIEPTKMVRCTGTLKKIDNSELDSRFDYAYKTRQRVEVTWKKGYEDYTGYGARTNGRKARFRVGKSTGWKPVYLMILRSDSLGGAAILSSAVENVRIIN